MPFPVEGVWVGHGEIALRRREERSKRRRIEASDSKYPPTFPPSASLPLSIEMDLSYVAHATNQAERGRVHAQIICSHGAADGWNPNCLPIYQSIKYPPQTRLHLPTHRLTHTQPIPQTHHCHPGT